MVKCGWAVEKIEKNKSRLVGRGGKRCESAELRVQVQNYSPQGFTS